MKQNPNVKEKDIILTDETENLHLILYNDDYNTIDFVIDSLVKICKHTIKQATQCTLIAHYKGKCEVKEGRYEKLKPMKDGLIDRGLTAAIE